jgi:hypothetical protein
MYFIESGKAVVSMIGSDGSERTVMIFGIVTL